MTQNISVRRIRESDLVALKSISDDQIGFDYLQNEDFLGDHYTGFCAEFDGRAIGFCICELDSQENVKKLIKASADLNRLLSALPINEIGFIQTIAVSSKAQRLGVGGRLMDAAISYLHESGRRHILMTAWESIKGIHIEKLALKNGFVELSTIPEFWKADSIKFKWDCPDCGNPNPPCICSAVIYKRPLIC